MIDTCSTVCLLITSNTLMSMFREFIVFKSEFKFEGVI